MIFWELPGPKRFIDKIIESLAMGKHVLAFFPGDVIALDPVTAIQNNLSLEGMGILTNIDVSTYGNIEPLAALITALGLDQSKVKTVKTLLEQEDMPSRFIYPLGIDSGDQERVKIFINIFSEIAKLTQTLDEIPFQLIVPVRGSISRPSEDLFLSIHEWWGVISRSDIDTVIRSHITEFSPLSVGEYYWLISITKALAGTDIYLAQSIIEESPKNLEEIIELLQNYRQAEGIYINGLDKTAAVVMPGSEKDDCPRDSVQRGLWAEGWLDWVEGNGPMVHSSILPAASLNEEVRVRIWRSQLEIFLPIVDQIRRVVLAWIEIEFGDNWLGHLTTGLSDNEIERTMVEIGPLAHHVFKYDSLFNQYHSKSDLVSDVVWKWRNIRNELAHGRFVEYQTINEAVRAYKRFDRS